jgi:FtsP/CotA-like multicopper oxidase with cupredoxin domain
MSNRRSFFKSIFGAGATLGTMADAANRESIPSDVNPYSTPSLYPYSTLTRSVARQGPRGPASVLVQTPDLPNLPYTVDNGVKVFHLIAEPVKQKILPNRTIDVWGYNGSAPGPTIQVTQGDRARIIVDNHLPEPTSMHWHGFEIPNDMDGVPGLVQAPIKPGGRFIYEFTLRQEGTYFYHSHMAMQEMMGMLGAFIMHPKVPYEPRVDKDFVILLQEYAVLPNNTVPNTMNMEFNWLVMNGKAGPAITPLIVRQGDSVRIRLINLGMDHHPIHLHGHTFYVTGTEGGRVARTAWQPGNTVLVGVAQSRDVEFMAYNPGEWMVHCHLPHHMMNQMSSNVGPMSRMGTGMPAGLDMNTGMGMLQGTPGAPSGEDYGPSLGRGMGVGSTLDQPRTNGPLSETKARAGMQGMEHDMAEMPGMDMQAGISPNANKVPGFPQDAYMEGPMMNMDKMVEKPENYGLRPGWTEEMQGMMTLIRVLPPAQYDEMMARIQRGTPQPMPDMPGMNHGA